MNILVIDTCNSPLGVAVATDAKLVTRIDFNQGRKYNSMLLPLIDEALRDADLVIKDIDAIACVVGAGSFTGIRLGVTTANGLAKAINAKLISLNIFEIMSLGSEGEVLALVDARHGNFYGGLYNDGVEQELGNYTEIEINNFTGTVMIKQEEFLVKNAVTIAKAKFNTDKFVDMLVPLYLKASQAERELCK